MSAEEKPDSPEKDAALRRRFHRLGILLLVAGLLAAEAIYLRAAPDDASGAIGYEVVDGKSYPIMPADSRSYQNQLERIGGKEAVLGVEITQWFDGLWHGRRLAYTVAFLSVGGFLACFFCAHLLTYPLPPEKRAVGRDP